MADFTSLTYESDDDSTFVNNNKTKGDAAFGGNPGEASFAHFQLKDELMKAIGECGFEHPSEVQSETIPQVLLGTDILCQAKSGMGKTAVFVLSLLHQIVDENHIQAIIIGHTRELALQIQKELIRFAKYLNDVRVQLVIGGLPYAPILKEATAEKQPHILVGTPGTLLRLTKEKAVNLSHVKHFVIDECDQIMESLEFRKTVQDAFRRTPLNKQVMMFTATLPTEIRDLCKRFMSHPLEIIIGDGAKLTLQGLNQYFVILSEKEKLRKLTDLMDEIQFDQLIIFTNTIKRAKALDQILKRENFPCSVGFGAMAQKKRTETYHNFREIKCPILVSTDMFARGIDFERVNVVINFDSPKNSDIYLHRVGRAGRFGTKGLAITFVTTQQDQVVLTDVRSKFIVELPELPKVIERGLYK